MCLFTGTLIDEVFASLDNISQKIGISTVSASMETILSTGRRFILAHPVYDDEAARSGSAAIEHRHRTRR